MAQQESPSGDPELVQQARRIVELAGPGEQVEVVLGRNSTTSVKVYKGDIEALTTAETAAVGVRVVVDGRQGFASAGSLDPTIMSEVLAEARDNVQFAEYDEFVAMAEPDGVEAVPVDLWREALVETPTQDKIDLAMEMERRVMAGDSRISGIRSASYGDAAGESAVVTSTGIVGYSRGTVCSVSALALAKDGDETQTGAGSSIKREPGELDLDEAATDAVDRATRLLGATQPASRKVTMVLEPRIAASILSIVGGMLAGDRVLKGRTPFADRMGEAIANSTITLVDDATNPESFGASAFDGEGLACRRTALIEDGVLAAFLYDSYSAARAGTRSTASAVRGTRSTPGVGWQALAIAPGTGSLDELIAGVDDGVLVQSFSGLHSGVNAISGDFSVGATGLAIRNGELAEPFREATIASTLPRMITSIAAVGADTEHLPSGLSSVSLVFDDINLSGS